jgi:multidrug efflux pump subunit AcrA (membrane-fusion protein)
VSATPVNPNAASGEKVYPAVIAIEGHDVNLRPGMSVSVSLNAGKSRDNVLTVPLRTILGKAVPGQTASCLVSTSDGPAEREVVIGLRDGNRVEIVSGLEPKEKVILNPQMLLDLVGGRFRLAPGDQLRHSSVDGEAPR